jgi:hypothetical protein
MFAIGLSSSAKAFHQIYMGESQECFLDGHKKAFEAFGGTLVSLLPFIGLPPVSNFCRSSHTSGGSHRVHLIAIRSWVTAPLSRTL